MGVRSKDRVELFVNKALKKQPGIEHRARKTLTPSASRRKNRLQTLPETRKNSRHRLPPSTEEQGMGLTRPGNLTARVGPEETPQVQHTDPSITGVTWKNLPRAAGSPAGRTNPFFALVHKTHGGRISPASPTRVVVRPTFHNFPENSPPPAVRFSRRFTGSK